MLQMGHSGTEIFKPLNYWSATDLSVLIHLLQCSVKNDTFLESHDIKKVGKNWKPPEKSCHMKSIREMKFATEEYIFLNYYLYHSAVILMAWSFFGGKVFNSSFDMTDFTQNVFHIHLFYSSYCYFMIMTLT